MCKAVIIEEVKSDVMTSKLHIFDGSTITVLGTSLQKKTF